MRIGVLPIGWQYNMHSRLLVLCFRFAIFTNYESDRLNQPNVEETAQVSLHHIFHSFTTQCALPAFESEVEGSLG